jgi:mRNA interferase MazF
VNPDEIYLAQFPFGDSPTSKLRPVLTLTGAVGSVPEVLVAYISSVIPPLLLPSDIILDPADSEHSTANLKVRSVIRLHKIATLHATSIVRRLGELPVTVVSVVDDKLRVLLNI